MKRQIGDKAVAGQRSQRDKHCRAHAYISCMRHFILLLAGFLIVNLAYGADGPCVDPQQSHFRIQVGTGGLFGAFAHNHLIEAQKITGCATLNPADLTRSSIRLVFTAADLRVMDPKESAKNRAEIQKTMETEVLRVTEYPEVVFESTSIEQGATSEQLLVRGKLTIRGSTQQVVIPVTVSRMGGGSYRARGTYAFKQTAFGIKPVQIGGGTIKVKDELQTEFDILLK